MNTRKFLKLSTGLIALAGISTTGWLTRASNRSENDVNVTNVNNNYTVRKITMSELKNLEQNPETVEKIELNKGEWLKHLDDKQFHVLRKSGTERAGTSHLNDEKRDGEYTCAGCGLSLFTSDKKYESGTGWPSFFQPIDGRLGTSTDFKIGYPRTEYHCARCKGHQGHVFKDGPQPTGLRYCNNGVALNFIPT